MAEPTSRRRHGLGVGAILVASAAGVLAYDRLVVETVVFQDSRWTATGERYPDGLAVLCVRRPLGHVEWLVERTNEAAFRDGSVAATSTTTWSAPLPRAGTFRAIDDHFVVVQLALDEEPCSAGRARRIAADASDVGPWYRLATDDETLPRRPDDSERTEREHYVDVTPASCTPPSHGAHEESWSGGWRPVHAAGSIQPHARTICLVEVATGLRFCVETWAAASERAVIGTTLVEVLEMAPVVITGRSLEDGRLLWRATVPTDAGEVWLVHTDDGRLGVRANEDYFGLDVSTGVLRRVTPEGADVCNAGDLVVAVADGVVSITRDDPFQLTPVARPGPEWRLVSCAADGIGVERRGRHAGAVPTPVSVADPWAALPAPGVAFYDLDLRRAVYRTTYTP